MTFLILALLLELGGKKARKKAFLFLSLLSAPSPNAHI